jgi:hypothetical protein
MAAITAYCKQQNTILTDVEVIKGIMESMTTLTVKRHFQATDARRDISPLMKLKLNREAMNRRYRVFSDSTLIDIQTEMEAFGYCRSDKDVLYLMEELTKLKEKALLLTRYAGQANLNAISDLNMKINLKRRMPSTGAYDQIREALDYGGAYYNAAWEDIQDYVTRRIRLKIKPMDEEHKEEIAAMARVNAAAEAEKTRVGGGYYGDKSRAGGGYYGEGSRTVGGGSGYGGKRQSCHEWDDKKSCRYGDTCRFAHNGGGAGRRQEENRPNRRREQDSGGERRRSASRSRSPAGQRGNEGKRAGGGVTFEGKKSKPTQQEYNQAHALIAAFEQKGGNETDGSET